ncbi:Mcp2p [Sugiyamaella lignohabitans]|uniref:Mcp2p n=1 Tax=Sugiyamaella lignohabitans TaxID=796027 RepID=A0A167F3Q3_9ASCO|nr:Mcp2p [Sugiyamaella lignohabitans]ANB14789.1 Mcp2p [Sugiyamaella lignohabitans]
MIVFGKAIPRAVGSRVIWRSGSSSSSRFWTNRFHSSGLKFKRHYEPAFQNVAAVSPQSLPKPKPPRKSKSGHKWRNRLIGVGIAGAAFYSFDRYFNASAITRSARCVYDILFIGLDYKFNFEKGKDIEALHKRSADRLFALISANKGLYIKMGQAIAIQAGVFPPQFREIFAQLFDNAPQDSWVDIEKLFKEEFDGKSPDEIFAYIDHRAIASASISQVHKAVLKGTGEVVAVKIQHCDLKKQVSWDLASYKGLMYIFEKFLFKFPIYFIAQHVANQLQEEVNFHHEVDNSERLRVLVESDPGLKDKIHVPKVYPELCTERVIVSEWIEGVSLSNREGLKKERYNTSQAIDSMTKLFAKQIFEWGLVHCDPHPGNMILRRVRGRQQLVLIDHGLYIYEAEKFRKQYAQLWRGLFLLDTEAVKQVAIDWGFGDTEMFASSTMMQAYRGGSAGGHRNEDSDGKSSKPLTKEERFEMEEASKNRFQNFMKDTTKIPLEIIFLGRAIRILQGCNRMFGSPVNRVKIFAVSASRATTVEKDLSLHGRLLAWKNHFLFITIVSLTDIYHFLTRVRNLFSSSSSITFEQAEDEYNDQVQSALEEL